MSGGIRGPRRPSPPVPGHVTGRSGPALQRLTRLPRFGRGGLSLIRLSLSIPGSHASHGRITYALYISRARVNSASFSRCAREFPSDGVTRTPQRRSARSTRLKTHPHLITDPHPALQGRRNSDCARVVLTAIGFARHSRFFESPACVGLLRPQLRRTQPISPLTANRRVGPLPPPHPCLSP